MDGTAREFTTLIQPSIKLIAVGQSTGEREAPTVARIVTVEAAPVQVASRAQAQATGRLTLPLVGVGDDTDSEAVTVNQSDVLGIEQPVLERSEQDCKILTRRGGEIDTETTPCAGDEPDSDCGGPRSRLVPID